MESSGSLDDLRLLVVEDQPLLGMMIEDELAELGCRTVGPAYNVREALELIAAAGSTLDGALLDINLRTELVYPVAEVLARRGVPFVFVTAYDREDIDPRFADVPLLKKPIDRDKLAAALRPLAET